MKKTVSEIIAVMMALVLASSCEKEGQGLFKGNYTFKTSGEVTAEIVIESPTNSTSSIMNPVLVTEQGQMDIIDIGGKDGEMMLTMNVLNGDVRCFKAHASGGNLILDPGEARVKVQIANHGTATVAVKVSGSAVRYDNVVIFDLIYAGEGKSTIGESTAEIKITDSKIQCVAKLNE